MINRWLIWKHLKFTNKTFPKGTAEGAAIHAGREIQEVIDDIRSGEIREKLVEEYADVCGCIIDSVKRSGITRREINRAFAKKLAKNKKRKWKDNGDGSYSHIKGEQTEDVPIGIQIMATPISILESEGNEATGEITKFKFTESCRNQHKFNDQVVGCTDGYDRIYRHIKND